MFYRTLVFILTFLALSSTTFGQVIRERYFPTENTDYFYFFLRHDNRPDEFLLGASGESKNDSVSKNVKLYLPVYSGKKFSLFIPGYYAENKYEAVAPIDKATTNLEIRKLFWQSIWNYKTDAGNQFTLITENRIRGTQELFDGTIGDDFAPLISYRFGLSKNWSMLVLARYLTVHKSTGPESNGAGGVQLFWEPSENFKIAFGVPGLLGLEASAGAFDLVTHTQLEDGAILHMSAVRLRATNTLSATLRYREDTDQIWTNETAITFDGTTYTYNRLKTKQHKISVELGYRFANEALVQLKLGKTISGEAEFLREKDSLIRTETKLDPFVGLDFAVNF